MKIIYALAALLLVLMHTAQATAQGSCDSFGTPDLTSNGGVVTADHGENDQFTITADFYVKPTSSLGQSAVYLSEGSAAPKTNPGPAVKFDNDLTIKFLRWNGTASVWSCGEELGQISDVAYNLSAAACPSWTPNQWYHVRIVHDVWSGYYTAQTALCDDTLTTHALNFKTAHSANTTWPYSMRYWSLDTVSSLPVHLHQMAWSEEITPGPNCHADGCATPLACALMHDPDQTYSVCPATTPDPFCAGQSLPASLPELEAAALTDDDPETWWDSFAAWLMELLGPDEQPHLAIAGGGTPVNHYGTAKLGCSGVVIGPYQVASAAHCFLAPDIDDPTKYVFAAATVSQGGVIDWDSWRTGLSQSVRVDSDPNLRYYVTSMRSPWYGTEYIPQLTDLVIANVRGPGPLPEPYIDEIYDPVADAALCTDVIAQGHDFGGLPNHECQYVIEYERTGPVETQLYGRCVDPPSAYATGGDSGGPVYAIGDWDGAGPGGEYAKLISTQGGGNPWNSTHAAFGVAHSAFFAANTPDFADPLLSMGAGIDVHDVWLDIDVDAGHDLGAAPLTFDCHVKLDATADPIKWAGCTMVNTVTKRRVSCVDETPTNGEYVCPITLGRRTGASWELQRIYAATVTGTEVNATMKQLGKAGAYGLRQLGLTQTEAADTTAPAIQRTFPPTSTAPGSEATCVLHAQESTIGSGVRNYGCVLTGPAGERVQCNNPQRHSTVSNGGSFCSVTIPSSATPGDTWSMTEVYAQDNALNSRLSTGPWDTFDIFDCGLSSVPDTVTGGWLGDQDETLPGGEGQVGGYNSQIEFWARAGATNQNGYVIFSEAATTGQLSEALAGIRFSSTGYVQALTDGTWSADIAYPYTAGQWYRFTLTNKDLTVPVGGNTPRYDVRVAQCGQPQSLLLTDALFGNGSRLLAGIEHWNAYAEGTQTVSVSDMDWTEIYCLATSCYLEGFGNDVECGTPPDGCGGVVADGPCGTCSGGTPDCLPDFTCGVAGPPAIAHDSIYSSAGVLYDACGDTFVPVGVNHHGFIGAFPGGPSDQDLDGSAFAEIAKTGANAVKIAWGTPSNPDHPNPAETGSFPDGFTLAMLDTQVQAAIDAGLIPIIAMYDSLGTNSTQVLADQTAWLTAPEQAAWFTGTDANGINRSEYIMLNAVLEPAFTQQATYISAVNSTIQTLRAAGYVFPIVIDANGWGQNASSLSAGAATWQATDAAALSPDPANLVLSYHPYNVQTLVSLQTNLTNLANTRTATGLPVLLGEFANVAANAGPPPGLCPDRNALLYMDVIAEANARSMGWLPWAWGDDPNGVNPGHYWNYDFGLGCWEYDLSEYETCASVERWGCDVLPEIASAAGAPMPVDPWTNARSKYALDRCDTRTDTPTPGACGDACGGTGGTGGTGGAGACAAFVPDDTQTGSSWHAVGPQTSAPDTLDLTFYARTTGLDSLVGISAGVPTSWENNAAVVRFNDAGNIDAATGADPNYSAENTVPYSFNMWYRFTVSVSLGAGTYTVDVAECDGLDTRILTNQPLRTERTAGALTYYSLWASTGVTIDTDQAVWTPGACQADTCASLGYICGTGYPDGCGGPTLDCDTPNGGTCAARPGGQAGDICVGGTTCCRPEALATTCAAPVECGNVTNNCGQTIDCDTYTGGCTGGETCNQTTNLCEAPPSGTVFFADTMQSAACSGIGFGFDEWCANSPIDNGGGYCVCGTNCQIDNCSDPATARVTVDHCTLETDCPNLTVPIDGSATCPGCIGGSKAVEMTASWNYSCAGCEGGSRVEIGIWPEAGGGGLVDTWKTNGETWFVSSEVFLPSLIYASSGYPWASIYDTHLHWNGGTWGGGWALYILLPGEFSAPADRGKLMFAGSSSTDGYPGNSGHSFTMTTDPMPIGEWFCLEMEYKSGTNANGELAVWFNGVEQTRETGITTIPNQNLTWGEIYWKWYGDAQGGTVVPSKQTIYRRNMRVTDYRSNCQ